MLLGARWIGYKFDRVAEKAVKVQCNTLQTSYGRARFNFTFVCCTALIRLAAVGVRLAGFAL